MTKATPPVERIWMTYHDVCRYASYDRTTIYRAVRRGELRQGGLPGSPRFEKSEVDRWLRRDGQKQNKTAE